MNQGDQMVLLVTDSNPQSALFVEYIHQQLSCKVSAVSDDFDIDGLECQKAVVLIDIDHVGTEAMQSWHFKAAECPFISLAAFNLRDDDHAIEILSMLHLYGVFYRKDSLDLICKGISKLLEGDFWMSRNVMTRMIEYYRRQQINSYRPVCGLTQREIEIIGLLGSGSSNTEIADKLFVSEHTVKSHIYNIFKKINVHNRIQAINWAKQNLGIPPIISSISKRSRRP